MIALAAMWCVGLIAARGGWLPTVATTIAAASPPMFLLVARGNTDIVVMLIFCAVGSYTVVRFRPWFVGSSSLRGQCLVSVPVCR